MNKKIVLILLFLTITLVGCGNTTDFDYDNLEQIALKTAYNDKEYILEKEEHEEFITKLNNYKYKRHKGIRSKGEYFIILKYNDKCIEVGQYYTNIYNKDGSEIIEGFYRMYEDDFKEFFYQYYNKLKVAIDYTEYKIDENIDIYIKLIDGMITNDYVVNDKNQSKMYHSQEQLPELLPEDFAVTVLKNRNIDNKQILLEFENEAQESNFSSEITVEEEYLIKTGINYRHIKRLQVLYSGDYEYLKEIFWDTTNNKIVSSQEMQDYFPFPNLNEG